MIVVGKYVFCEKFLVMLLVEVCEMIDVVKVVGVYFVINYYLCCVGSYCVIC